MDVFLIKQQDAALLKTLHRRCDIAYLRWGSKEQLLRRTAFLKGMSFVLRVLEMYFNNLRYYVSRGNLLYKIKTWRFTEKKEVLKTCDVKFWVQNVPEL